VSGTDAVPATQVWSIGMVESLVGDVMEERFVSFLGILSAESQVVADRIGRLKQRFESLFFALRM